MRTSYSKYNKNNYFNYIYNIHIIYIYIYIYILYHGVWAITIVTFDVPRELYAHNLLADSVKFHSLHNEILNDKL